MLTIELDYKNSKEKLIKSFNKKIEDSQSAQKIYLHLTLRNQMMFMHAIIVSNE